MPLTDPAYLEHIRAACLEVARDLRDAGIDDLSAPSAWRNSVLYSLIVIGEAVNRLSPGLTARYPDIPTQRFDSPIFRD